jgi:hypothetical protein
MPSLVQCLQCWVCFACLIAVCSANGAPTSEGDVQQLSEGHWEKRSLPKHKKDKHGHRDEEETKDEIDHHKGHKKSKDKKHQKPVLVKVEDPEPCLEEHKEPYSVPISVPVDRPYPVEVQVPQPQPYPVYIREPYPVYVVQVAKSRPQSVYVPVKVRSKYEFVSRPYLF